MRVVFWGGGFLVRAAGRRGKYVIRPRRMGFSVFLASDPCTRTNRQLPFRHKHGRRPVVTLVKPQLNIDSKLSAFFFLNGECAKFLRKIVLFYLINTVGPQNNL